MSRIVIMLGLLSLLFPHYGNAQIRIQDSESGLPIEHATIQALSLNSQGMTFLITDSKGIIELPSEILPCVLSISHVSYKTKVDTARVLRLTIPLIPSSTQLSDVVVTGQYNSQSASNSVYKVKTIGSERLSKLSAGSLEQVLSFELGIQLAYDPALGSTSMKMQGMGGQNVKILIDGVPLVGKTGSDTDLGQINLSSIERIEVVEGPMAVSYGSNALAGVINIITKKQVGNHPEIELELREESVGREYGISAGIHQQYLALGFPIKTRITSRFDFQQRFFGGYQGDSEGRTPDWLPKISSMASGKVAYALSDWSFDYSWNFLDEKILRDGEPSSRFNPLALDEEYLTNRMVNSIQVEKKLKGGRFHSIVSLGNYRRLKVQYAHNLVNGTETLASSSDAQDTSMFKTLIIRGAIATMLNKKISHEIGYDINLDASSGGRIQSGIQSVNDYAVFESLEFEHHKIQLRPGIRLSYNSAYGTSLLPSLNAKFIANPDLILRASYAKGFRSPSLRELYFEFIDSNHSIVGNENLLPEKSNHLDLALSHEMQRSKFFVRSDISLFYNNLTNRIAFGASESDPTITTYINIDSFWSAGTNLTNRFSHKNVSASIGFSATKWADQFAGVNSKSDPHLNGEVMFDLSWSSEKIGLTTSFFYKYTGKQASYQLRENNGTIEIVEVLMDNYHWADFTLSKNIIERFRIDFGIRNLFNVRNINSNGQILGSHSAANSRPVGYGRSYFIKINYSLKVKNK